MGTTNITRGLLWIPVRSYGHERAEGDVDNGTSLRPPDIGLARATENKSDNAATWLAKKISAATKNNDNAHSDCAREGRSAKETRTVDAAIAAASAAAMI